VEIYETEEEQLEALKRWWKNNGTSTIVGVVLGITVILGWNYWQTYKKDRLEQASNLYVELNKAVAANQKDSVEKLSERLQTEFAATHYAAYSNLMLAKFKVEQGDIAGAKKVLEQVAALSDKELSNIAKIRLVRLMMATKEFEQGLKLINSIDPATTNHFANQYDELVGDLYVALNRPEQARTSYLKAQENGHQSPLLQAKIDDLTPPEKVGVKK
jgi:predicted negative regulator of RcsB-dependent stress response